MNEEGEGVALLWRNQRFKVHSVTTLSFPDLAATAAEERETVFGRLCARLRHIRWEAGHVLALCFARACVPAYLMGFYDAREGITIVPCCLSAKTW